MVRWLARVVLVIGFVGPITGCKSHWTAEVTQPALTLQADKATRTSIPLTIMMRDMELRHARLANTAYYVVVSRDRLRFHVTLRHKWESMSDLRTWETWVEDAAGVRHPVEEIHQRVMQLGFVVPIYRSVGDFTAYGRDLSASERVTLVLRRPGYEYRYVWRSESDPDDAAEVPPASL
jgi:hypothetical protein